MQQEKSPKNTLELINAYSNEQQNIDAETELLNAEIKNSIQKAWKLISL